MGMAKTFDTIRGFRSLVEFEAPKLPTQSNALAAVSDISGIQRLARRRMPKFVMDYVEGGAFGEESIAANRRAFAKRKLVSSVLTPVAKANTAVNFLGQDYAMPIGIAPTGLTGLVHAAAEVGGVKAAQTAGIPFSLSTMSTQSIEEIATAAPSANKWFQLYLRTDREKSLKLIHRALAAGFETLILTVDTPVAGRRMRDNRNGLSLPPKLRLSTALDVIQHPKWGMDFMKFGAPRLANFGDSTSSISGLVNEMFDPDLSMSDLEWLRRTWPHKLIVKGIVSVEDALRVVAAGADAICISNHGGRQLDRAVAPLDVCAEIRSAVGPDMPIIIDSGITSGLDVVTALATGANFVLIGRSYLYGLGAGGQAGVERAVAILAEETKNAMQLLGVSTPAELSERHLHKGHRSETEFSN